MYCNECGHYLKDTDRFCIQCGSARPEIIPGPKGTRWIPALLLVLMAGAGFAVYYFTVWG